MARSSKRSLPGLRRIDTLERCSVVTAYGNEDQIDLRGWGEDAALRSGLHDLRKVTGQDRDHRRSADEDLHLQANRGSTVTETVKNRLEICKAALRELTDDERITIVRGLAETYALDLDDVADADWPGVTEPKSFDRGDS